jgi:hypothetical protein
LIHVIQPMSGIGLMSNVSELSPLPQRVRWFAVWTWRPRNRWAALAALAVLIVATIYPLSLGPAAALATNGNLSARQVAVFYRPVLFAHKRSPTALRHLFLNYLTRCAGDWTCWQIDLCQQQWEFDVGLTHRDPMSPDRLIEQILARPASGP